RAFVTQTFRDAFRIAGMGETDHGEDTPAARTTDTPYSDLNEQIEQLLSDHADTIRQRVESLLDSHRIRSLPASSRRRDKILLPAIIDMAAKSAAPPTTAIRLPELVEHIVQRRAYLPLLAEYPETISRSARTVR